MKGENKFEKIIGSGIGFYVYISPTLAAGDMDFREKSENTITVKDIMFYKTISDNPEQATPYRLSPLVIATATFTTINV